MLINGHVINNQQSAIANQIITYLVLCGFVQLSMHVSTDFQIEINNNTLWIINLSQ